MAVNKMKNDKAMGSDRKSMGVWKSLTDFGVQLLGNRSERSSRRREFQRRDGRARYSPSSNLQAKRGNAGL